MTPAPAPGEAPVFTLIEGGEIYDPEPRGRGSLLMVNGRVAQVGAVDGGAVAALGLPCEVVDARGCVVTPGFIDPHEHLIGAGGEEGFASRTPEVTLEEILLSGLTTVVGCLGTDTITRSLKALAARTAQLEQAGVSAFMYTGGFPVPTPTITPTIMEDLTLIAPVIGVGEIAIADNRAVAPALQELAKLVSAAFLGGLMAGKAGVTHFHTGPGESRLAIIRQLIAEHDVPIDHLYITHIERSEALMDEAIGLARQGAYVDIDTVEEDLGRWLRYYREHDGPPDNLTVSSDAHAGTGRMALFSQFVDCAHGGGIPLAELLPLFTRNTATALQLRRKGRLAVGMDGDALILKRDTLEIVALVARGRRLVQDGKLVKEETA
jgi:beta-aspartyl-dipeptidase (metallo-type)